MTIGVEWDGDRGMEGGAMKIDERDLGNVSRRDFLALSGGLIAAMSFGGVPGNPGG